MFVQIGEKEFELSTNLGVVKQVEGRFKKPLASLLSQLDDATVDEMITILSYGLGGKQEATEAGFIEAIDNEVDYMTIWEVLQEFIVSMMFSGTPEQKEAKIARSDFGEPQKNVFRRMLGLPTKDIPEPDMSIPEN